MRGTPYSTLPFGYFSSNLSTSSMSVVQSGRNIIFMSEKTPFRPPLAYAMRSVFYPMNGYYT